MTEKIKDTKKPLSQDNEVSEDNYTQTEQASEKKQDRLRKSYIFSI